MDEKEKKDLMNALLHNAEAIGMSIGRLEGVVQGVCTVLASYLTDKPHNPDEWYADKFRRLAIILETGGDPGDN